MNNITIVRRQTRTGEALHMQGVDQVAQQLNLRTEDIVYPLTAEQRSELDTDSQAHVYRVPRGHGKALAERMRMLLAPRGVQVAVAG